MIKNILDQNNLEGKTVLVRAGLNVPIGDGKVENDFRIKSFEKTLRHLVDQGSKVVVISHIGRTTDDSFEPVFQYLKQKNYDISFYKDFFKTENLKDDISSLRESIDSSDSGSVFLLDSLRHSENEKGNEDNFSRELAKLGDIYVNDAFSVCHREHASIVGVSKNFDLENVFGGAILCEEYSNLEKSFNPTKPGVFVLGGNKFETKIPLIESFLETYDHIIVGGALANNFFRAKGYEIGESVVDDIDYDFKALMENEKIIVPTHVTVEDGTVKMASEVQQGEKILDISDHSFCGNIENIIKNAGFVLWNGPMGYYETGFVQGTQKLVKIISQSDAVSIAGGGNTVSAIEFLEKSDEFTFISTAGGAMMDFLTSRTLPGLEALGYKK